MSHKPTEQHDGTPQQPMHQYVQPQQPSLVSVPPTVTPIPVTGSGRGLTGKLPQLENCCLCFPLQTGAMIIAFLMIVLYSYSGIPLLIAVPALLRFTDSIYMAIIAIIFGILYMSIATVSVFGFVGILRERLDWVKRFVKWYFIGCCIWLTLETVGAILTATGLANDSNADVFRQMNAVAWILWVVLIAIALAFQYYFWCALVSYERVLEQKSRAFDGLPIDGGVHVAKDVAMV